MGYNLAKQTMAELRSTYVFDRDEDFENVKDALSYHLGGYSSSTWDYYSSYREIYIYEDCSDITRAASICKEHGGKYKTH
jgi:hypothetical protein